MAQCPNCGSKQYKHDWGCVTCGLGNPLAGIVCLTPKLSAKVVSNARDRDNAEKRSEAQEAGDG